MRKKYLCGRVSKKYWKYLMMFIIDCACTIAYIVFREDSPKEEINTVGRKRMCIGKFCLCWMWMTTKCHMFMWGWKTCTVDANIATPEVQGKKLLNVTPCVIFTCVPNVFVKNIELTWLQNSLVIQNTPVIQNSTVIKINMCLPVSSNKTLCKTDRFIYVDFKFIIFFILVTSDCSA